jgi:uncharacterized protein (TIGR03435 family)
MTAIQFLTERALRSPIPILSGALLLRALRVKDPSIRLAAWTAVLCGSLETCGDTLISLSGFSKRVHRSVNAARMCPEGAQCATIRSGCAPVVAAILALGSPMVAAQVTAPQQSAAGKALTFDVASVKPAIVPDGVTVVGEMRGVRKGSGITLPRNTGGPGTDDPGRIHFPLISLKALLVRAWDSYFEIEGPGWLDTQIVQVDATMPPDTTKAQFQEMLRNLITDRFQLKHHAETKQVTGYSLVVTKNGLKMKESADQSAGAPGPFSRATQRGPDGFLMLPPRTGPWSMSQSIEGGRTRMVFQQQTMQDLTKALGRMLNSTVTDATGLTAKYDYTVTFAGATEPGGALAPSLPASQPDAAEPLPDIFGALQSQLGLRLEPKKVAVEVFAVDHMEKTPTGN